MTEFRTLICSNIDCGKEFKREVWKRFNNPCCSKECQNKFRSDQVKEKWKSGGNIGKKTELIPLTCTNPDCKKLFTRPKHLHTQYIKLGDPYCSISCAGKIGGKVKSPRTTPMINLNCSRVECNKEFTKRLRDFNFFTRKGQTEFYCSNRCQLLVSLPKSIEARQNYEQNFLEKINKSPGLGPWGNCWEWAGMINKVYGYGYMIINKHNVRAHRFSYELYNNIKLDSKTPVLHSCDNRRCVNPQHLSTGTFKDNFKDIAERGRFKLHDKVEDTHLTQREVLLIRRNYDLKKDTIFDLANLFNCSEETIKKIVNREIWIGIEYS